MTTLVCFLDTSHRVFQNGYLSADSRFKEVSDAFNTKIEINVGMLSKEEQRYSVLRNVSTEDVDPSWVEKISSVKGDLSWAIEIEPEYWPRVVRVIFDIDFSGVKAESLFAKIINVQYKDLNVIHGSV